MKGTLTNPRRRGAALWLLGALAFGLAGGAMADSASLAKRLNQKSTELDASDACLASCETDRQYCGPDQSGYCGQRYTSCVDRCDPQRFNTRVVVALYPPSVPTVSGPRHLLPPAQQLAICKQECSLGNSSCMAASSRGGAGGMGGNDQERSCARAQGNCEARCDAKIAGDTSSMVRAGEKAQLGAAAPGSR